MRIRLLGAVAVLDGAGAPVALGGVRLRGLLARLALDAGRPVPATTLVDDLWGTDPPGDATNALQALVSRLRRAVGAELVVTEAGGYRLRVAREDVDVERFDALLAAGAAQAALDLWRGPALADVATLPFVEPVVARLDDRRAVAVERAADAALSRGDAAGEIDRLAAQLDALPLRETTAALLARALHAAGRQADALAVLDRTRGLLVETLGVDPGAEWSAAHLAVLRDERPSRSTPSLPLTSFVGRDRDVERLRRLLPTTRLVTLTGPGGAGKTRLATTVAVEHGARIAELAALTEPERLPVTLLTAVAGPEPALRIPDEPAPDPMSRLVTALAGRDALVVLDNCEHIVDAVARLVETLLVAAPGLRVLATSREPLGVPGEVLHPVAALADDDAVRLFADRAAAASPDFALTTPVKTAVREICRRLDGQPLPIELAAARTRSMSPVEIAARLDDRFRLLTGGARTAMPRHQTLRAVVDWSWDLLTEPERAVARRLGAFAGSASAAAIEKVCSAPGTPSAEDVFALLTALVDRSLVVAVPRSDGGTRYRMLETIRVYAAERLVAAGEEAAAHAAHTAVVVELAEAAEPRTRGHDQLVWLDRVDVESDELAAVFDRSITGGDADTAHRLVAALAVGWAMRGRLDQAGRWAVRAHRLDGPSPPTARALTTALAGMSAVFANELDRATTLSREAVRIADDLPEPRHPVLTVLGPAVTSFVEGDRGPLRRLGDDADDPWARGIALMMVAQQAENEGRVDEQRELVRRAHAAFRLVGDRFGLGTTLHTLGELEDLAGDHDAAARAYDQSITLARELNSRDDLPQFQVRRAMLDARRGRTDAARTLLREVLASSRAVDDTGFSLRSFQHTMLADVERRSGDLDAARAELGTARAQLDDHGFGLPQRTAMLELTAFGVELAAGDHVAAAAALSTAIESAASSTDGPVMAAVAEGAARLAVARDEPRAAAEALGVAIARRGAADLGEPDVVAAHAAVRAALGDEAEALIEKARAWDRETGTAALRAIAGSDVKA